MNPLQPVAVALRRLAFAALAAASLASPMACSATTPQLTIVLSPAAAAAGGNIPYVDVQVVASDIHVAAGKPLLRLPLVSSNVTTIAASLEHLRVSDSSGALSLMTRDDPSSGPMPFRHWYAARAVAGTLTVHYRAPITNALNSRGAAPPLELRTEEGGFSGDASTFLMLPEANGTYHVALRWNLAALGPNAVGLSTLGAGDVAGAGDHPAPRNLSDLYGRGLYFMGGLVHVYPAPLPGEGFMSAWQGEPPFDARALMRWTRSLYGSYLRFFRAPPRQPYEIFLRTNLVNAGGGVEVGRSFVGTFDRATRQQDFKLTLAHEMVHTFVGGLDEPQGLLSSWYAEGLAVYYEMSGKLVLPASDAFGGCFERTTVRLRRYQLGFDSQVLMEPSRLVRGLLPGSAAARAGLRNGDRIVKPVPQDAIQANQHAMLTLLIERNGRTFPITYLPRGATVPAYQWRRRSGVPDRACGL